MNILTDVWSDKVEKHTLKSASEMKNDMRPMELRSGKVLLYFRLCWLRLNLFCLPIFLLMFCSPVDAGAASFTAALDRDTITLGEPVTLSLTFEGGQSKNVPTPQVPGLQIVQTGTSQNVSFINGAMSSTVTITFSVMARQVGEFAIPSLTADVNGQQLATEPLKLTVLKADAPPAAAIDSGNEIAFMKLSLPNKKIYVGQMLTAQLQVCWRDDAQNFGNFQLTGTPADGFTIGKMAQGQGRRTQIGNRIGFRETSSFSRTFRRFTGLTPTEYRRHREA